MVHTYDGLCQLTHIVGCDSTKQITCHAQSLLDPCRTMWLAVNLQDYTVCSWPEK